MARALLREDQIGDRDNLSEDEHDVLVHENLVTSGTLNFQDGTISGTGDVYANAYYGDGSTLSGVGGGNPASLYYNTTDVKATAIAAGISITDGTATAATIDFSGDNLRIKNNEPGGDFAVLTRNTADDTDYTRISMDGDSGMTFYYGGSAASHSKIQVTLAGLAMYGANTGAQGNFSFSGNDLYIDNLVDGADVYMRGQVATNTYKTLFKGAPDGAAELYYAGLKSFESMYTGIKVQHCAADDPQITLTANTGSTEGYIRFASEGYFEVVNKDSELYLQGIPNSSVDLYYNGNKAFGTFSNGVQIFNPADSSDYLHIAVGDTISLINDTQGGGMSLVCEKTGGGNATGFSFTPDSSAFLYHVATPVLRTFTSASADVGTGVLAYGPGYTGIQIGTYEGNGILYNWDHGGYVKIRGENDAGSAKDLFVGDPDGAAELYYLGDKTVETTASGIKINSGGEVLSDGTNIELWHDGTKAFETTTAGISIEDGTVTPATIGFIDDDLYIKNNDPDGKVYIAATKNAGGESLILNADPDGTAYLYNNGNWRLATHSNGAEIRGLHSSSMLITIDSSGNNDLLGQAWGGTWGFRQKNAVGDETQLFKGDPDGAAELYHAGEKQLETVVSGVEIPVDNFMYFGDTTTSGSWRMGISGEDFIHQKYNGSSWETKQTIVG